MKDVKVLEAAIETQVEFTIRQASLLQALQLVIGAVEKKQSMEILSHIWIQAEADRLSFLATDLEVELKAIVEGVNISQAGQLTLPGRKMMDICRSLPSDAEITVSAKAGKVLVGSGRSRFNLLARTVDDFPRIDVSQSLMNFSIPERALKFLLESTHFAMAQQDVRYFLNGLLLELQQDRLTVVATNGHRLAKSTFVGIASPSSSFQAIFPRKSVLELMRLLGETDTPLTLSMSDNHFNLTAASYSFTSKLIEGRYPDYRRAIPAKTAQKIKLDRDSFKQALMRVSILSNEKIHGVYLELRQNQLRIVTNNPEQEEAEEFLAVDYGGPDLDVGFNATYMVEALNALPSGEIQFNWTDGVTSVLIESEKQPQTLYVVMPMRF